MNKQIFEKKVKILLNNKNKKILIKNKKNPKK